MRTRSARRYALCCYMTLTRTHERSLLEVQWFLFFIPILYSFIFQYYFPFSIIRFLFQHIMNGIFLTEILKLLSFFIAWSMINGPMVSTFYLTIRILNNCKTWWIVNDRAINGRLKILKSWDSYVSNNDSTFVTVWK